MKSWFRRAIIGFSFLYSSLAAANIHETFVPSEHAVIGDNITLHFASHDAGQKSYVFHLPNGLTLTYGEIISLGDFYGIVDQPIAYGASDAERKTRFLAAFHLLAQSPASLSEANQILAVIRDERKTIETALKKGENPEEVYKRINSENNRQYNCITGGGCSTSTWWTQPGRYLKLAANNYDHFGDHAWLAYQAGHDAALEQAMLASQTHDPEKLELAYAMNALASHFLSDRFSAGHIRTPREELSTKVTPNDVGATLAGFMHNEENSNGIHVHNLRGDEWVAYGDGSYFNQKSSMHRIIINDTLQASANQVFSAYESGNRQDHHDDVYRLIPFANELKNASRIDISPLFYWDDSAQKLMRREDTENLYDRHWISSWWGWSTLALLTKHRGLPSLAQASLALSGNGEKAMQYGIITDKDVASYIRRDPSSKKRSQDDGE